MGLNMQIYITYLIRIANRKCNNYAEKMLMARGRGGACKIQRFERGVDCVG